MKRRGFLAWLAAGFTLPFFRGKGRNEIVKNFLHSDADTLIYHPDSFEFKTAELPLDDIWEIEPITMEWSDLDGCYIQTYEKGTVSDKEIYS